ncbi:MAG: hypothetical protein V7K32_07940 [Nostoc sp.]|uniref:hypothetical protein n=1 Tax=Nostoc sp. TaxID=1180 RepID=UPI002FF4F56E
MEHFFICQSLTYQYIILLPASGDLQAIADYFAVENIEVGKRLLYVFNQKCQQLVVSFPDMRRQYDDLRPVRPKTLFKFNNVKPCPIWGNKTRFYRSI